MRILSAEQPLNARASLWTIGVHVLLVLLLLLIKYSAPAIDELPDLGMEVNLGSSDDGFGTDQPMAVENPAPDAVSVSYRTSTSESSNAKDIERTDDKDAPAIDPTVAKTNMGRSETKSNTKRPSDRQALNNNNTRPQKPRYVYNGGTGSGGNTAAIDASGTNEGNANGKGDRGVPSGTPGAANYSGIPGSGNGISHTLSRRSIVAFPPPDAYFREGGKVTVRITVNREGAIVNKQVVSASNAELRAIALKKLDKVKFNKSKEAPEEQFGNITFVFKTRS